MTWEGPEESYNIFRWYKAGWGRYTQADPLAPGGRGVMLAYHTRTNDQFFKQVDFSTMFNVDPRGSVKDVGAQYSYAAGQPLNNTDPTGLRSVPCIAYLMDINRIPVFSRPHGPDGPLIGTCTLVGACPDLLTGQVYIHSIEISHPVPCPPCPNLCRYSLDLETHTVLNNYVACTRD